jgi:hypothetical protein
MAATYILRQHGGLNKTGQFTTVDVSQSIGVVEHEVEGLDLVNTDS